MEGLRRVPGGSAVSGEKLEGTLGCARKKENMKKLMIAASAALCAAVSFGVGLTSANTVGYNGSALDEDFGAVMTGPQFVIPGGSVFPITNIVLVSSGDTAGAVAIQTLNNYGGTGDEDYTWTGTGWVDTNTGADASNVKIAPGKGLWVYNFTGEAVGFHIPAPEL